TRTWRHPPVRTLCAASRQARRQNRARSTARTEIDLIAARRRRRGGGARRGAAALRCALPTWLAAIGAENRIADGAGANSISGGRRSASAKMVGADRKTAAPAHRARLGRQSGA